MDQCPIEPIRVSYDYDSYSHSSMAHWPDSFETVPQRQQLKQLKLKPNMFTYFNPERMQNYSQRFNRQYHGTNIDHSCTSIAGVPFAVGFLLLTHCFCFGFAYINTMLRTTPQSWHFFDLLLSSCCSCFRRLGNAIRTIFYLTKIIQFVVLLRSVPAMKTSGCGTWNSKGDEQLLHILFNRYKHQDWKTQFKEGQWRPTCQEHWTKKNHTNWNIQTVNWIFHAIQYWIIALLHVLCQGNNWGNAIFQGATENATVDSEGLANCQSQQDSKRVFNSTFAWKNDILQFSLLKIGR